MTQQPSAERPRRGYQRSFAGLIGAMIAVVGFVAVLTLLGHWQSRPVPDPAHTVDYTAALAAARQESPFRVLAPEPVPAGLRATSVSWNPVGRNASWHLGFLTTGDQYVGLYQGTAPATRFVRAHTPATVPGPPVTVRGQTWRTYTDGAQGETALVRTADGVTTVVTGTASEDQLREFVASLR